MKNTIIHVLLLLSISTFYSQSNKNVRVTYSETTSLRSLAKEYFNSPNDWEIILKHNGYESPSDISIGAPLIIPVKDFQKMESYFKSYSTFLSKANKEGSALLANELVVKADLIYVSAVDAKKKGDLKIALLRSKEAKSAAEKAFTVTKGKRTQSISAKLKDKDGKVQSLKKNNTSWSDTEKNQELFEKEKVRTLKNATGLIAFVDGSHITMGENALVVIEHSKQDVITRASRSDVLILEGDASTYLKSASGKNQMNIRLPGVQTKIRSSKFWVSRDEKKVIRISNFDGELDVFTRHGSITIKKNEGSKIEPGKKPEKPKELIDSPEMISPKNGSTTYKQTVLFRWNNVKSASEYKIQIADDPQFLNILAERFTSKNRYSWKFEKQGRYSVRVSSVNSESLPGEYSSTTQFTLLIDNTSPYLSIMEPYDGFISYSKDVIVKGEVEVGNTVVINKKRITSDADGFFEHSIHFSTGTKVIRIESQDKAGNKSVVENQVIVIDPKSILNTTSENIITNKTSVVISQNVRPFTEYELKNKHIYNSSSKLNLVVKTDEKNLNLAEQNGSKKSKSISIAFDGIVPKLHLDNFSEFTNMETITLSGSVDSDAYLSINGRKVTLEASHFTFPINLKRGKNIIVFSLNDDAENSLIKKIEINRDDQLPEVSSVNLTNTGSDYSLSIEASGTGSPLSRTCFVKLLNGSKIESHFVELNRDTNKYEANFSGLVDPKVTFIQITDYSQNTFKMTN